MISLPTNFVADMVANSTGFLSALAPYLSLVLGVLFTILVVSILINSVKK